MFTGYHPAPHWTQCSFLGNHEKITINGSPAFPGLKQFCVFSPILSTKSPSPGSNLFSSRPPSHVTWTFGNDIIFIPYSICLVWHLARSQHYFLQDLIQNSSYRNSRLFNKNTRFERSQDLGSLIIFTWCRTPGCHLSQVFVFCLLTAVSECSTNVPQLLSWLNLLMKCLRFSTQLLCFGWADWLKVLMFCSLNFASISRLGSTAGQETGCVSSAQETSGGGKQWCT
jgi:hypothetical protein